MTNSAIIERCAGSLIDLGKVLVGEMMTAASPEFHVDMEAHLRDVRQRQLVIVAPRGHAKSSVAACLLVLWHIFLEHHWRFKLGILRNEPEQRQSHVVLISKTRGEAIKRLDTIKSILGDNGEYSAGFRGLFGNWGEETARRWTSTEIVLKDGTIITALGTGQQARGLKKKHLRPTLIVADDPEDENNTKTDVALSDNRKWLLQAVVPSLDQRRGRVVVIGTPINTQCLVVRLHKAKGWRALWYKNHAEDNASSWYDSATREWTRRQGVLWPSYVSRRKLLNSKMMADSLGMLSSYYREWECEIVGDEEAIFRPEFLLEWEGELKFDGVGKAYLDITRRGAEAFPSGLRIPVAVFTGVDPASSVATGADKTAVVNVAADSELRFYILEQGVHQRLPPDALVQAVADNHRLVRPTRGVIETVAAFVFVWQYLQRDHGIVYMQDKPIAKKKGEGSRLESLQPLFAQRRVFLPPAHDTGRSQLLSYPRGEDDWLDALEKAIRIATRPYHAVIDSAEENQGRRKVFDPMLA